MLSSWRGSCTRENRSPLGILSPKICIWQAGVGVEGERIAILYAQPWQATRSFCAQFRLELTTYLPPALILTLLCVHQHIAPPKGLLCRLELLPQTLPISVHRFETVSSQVFLFRVFSSLCRYVFSMADSKPQDHFKFVGASGMGCILSQRGKCLPFH